MLRRKFLASALSGLVMTAQSSTEKLPPIRALTRGPRFHWFGYYHKLQFDASSRYILGMASLQHPYVFHVRTGTRLPLGHLLSPPEYTGEWRVDNHPRFSPDGTQVCIDSPHGGNGRQMYLIRIDELKKGVRS